MHFTVFGTQSNVQIIASEINCSCKHFKAVFLFSLCGDVFLCRSKKHQNQGSCRSPPLTTKLDLHLSSLMPDCYSFILLPHSNCRLDFFWFFLLFLFFLYFLSVRRLSVLHTIETTAFYCLTWTLIFCFYFAFTFLFFFHLVMVSQFPTLIIQTVKNCILPDDF